jgi:hypothetical protein
VGDLKCLAMDMELDEKLQSFFMRYLEDRNTNFSEEEDKIYILPNLFVNNLSPFFDEKIIEFKTVRNITKLQFGDKCIFKNCSSVIMNA